jgi:excisionase family DNA binding protein
VAEIELTDRELDRLADLLAPRIRARSDADASAPAALLTCAQAAQRAGAHIETIRRAVRSGALPAGRVGRSARIEPADLDAWLAPAADRPRRPRTHSRRPKAGRNPMADAIAALGDGARRSK